MKNNSLTIFILSTILLLLACNLVTSQSDAEAAIADAARLTIEAQEQSPEYETPMPKEIVSTLPAPLSDVQFPTELIDYPSDWPDELVLPNEFNLVEITSGPFPGEQTNVWGAKYKISATPKESVESFEAFILENRWEIVERNDLESGGVEMLIVKTNMQGIIIIDLDSNVSNHTIMLMTVFSN